MSTVESRSNRIVSEYRRPTQFAKATAREDYPLRVRGAQVAMEAAIHPLDYTSVDTTDLVEMAQIHLDAMGFRAFKPNSRATALAALMGVRMGR